MNKYCDIEKFKNEYLHKVGTQFDNAISEMQKDRFCVNAITISENTTNGDVIKALFPNEDDFNDGHGAYFYKDWWNAPYKAESEEV